MKKVLVVEDQTDIQEIIKAFLQDAGYTVETAGDGLEGIEKFNSGDYGLVLLDVLLPKIDGFAVCEFIRKDSSVPIIILTALDDEQQQLKGFELMADDYITKPFSLDILLKRVQAVLRRSETGNVNGKIITYKNIKLDKNAFKAETAGRPVELTIKEFELLELLIENKGHVLTRDTILDRVWGYDYFGDTRVVDTHIKNLRHKLDVDYIKTVRKVGYTLESSL
jgi:two-component system, OmpR family, response regulator VanR